MVNICRRNQIQIEIPLKDNEKLLFIPDIPYLKRITLLPNECPLLNTLVIKDKKEDSWRKPYTFSGFMAYF
jgi:hypothetical protein